MLQLLGLIGGLLAFVGYLPYSIEILQHKAKPQRSAFFIWLVLGLIAVFSQLAKGATSSLWLPGLETVGSLAIFLLSIKYGHGGFSKKDYVALLISAVGLIAWYFTQEAAVALYLVILVDASGLYLVLHKAYFHPKTETITPWLLSGIGGMCTLLAVGSWNIILLSYPIYVVLANIAVIAALQVGYRRKK